MEGDRKLAWQLAVHSSCIYRMEKSCISWLMNPPLGLKSEMQQVLREQIPRGKDDDRLCGGSSY